jgi:hypothetical protein
MFSEPDTPTGIVGAIRVDLLLLPTSERGFGAIYIYAVGGKIGGSWI